LTKIYRQSILLHTIYRKSIYNHHFKGI
jgi:hypothetical protein